MLSGSARAEPFYQQDPFDEVALDKENKNAVLKTFPLELANRKVPEELPQSGELELRLLDRPDQLFRVPWQSIKKVRLFEEMILDEALQLVKDGNFDDAYENFRFLERKYPQCPGLPEGVDRFLAAQMSAAYKAARYDEALAALVELHRRNPQRKGLAEAWQRVANYLIEAHASAGNYAAARNILDGLSQRFPENAAETVEKWTTHFSAEGQRFLAEARRHLAAGQFRQAHLASTRMLDVWPEIEGGQELLRRAFAKYPHVTVGVGSSYAVGAFASPDDWAVRRARQLLQRPLLELVAFGNQGGKYTAASGSYETDEQRQRVTLRLDAGDSSQRGTTAGRAARPLLSAIDPRDPAFNWGWTRVVGAISAQSLFELRVEFRRASAPSRGLALCPLRRPPCRLGEHRRGTKPGPAPVSSRDGAAAHRPFCRAVGGGVTVGTRGRVELAAAGSNGAALCHHGGRFKCAYDGARSACSIASAPGSSITPENCRL